MTWYEWLGDDYNTQIREITDITLKTYPGMKHLHFDRTASQDMAGDVLKNKLIEGRFQGRVEGVSFSGEKSEMYKNLSMLMHDTFMDERLVEKSLLRFPVGFSREKEKFIKQFLDLQKDIKNGRWVCNHPEGPNYHDDYCDSLALAALPFKVSKKKFSYSVY